MLSNLLSRLEACAGQSDLGKHHNDTFKELAPRRFFHSRLAPTLDRFSLHMTFDNACNLSLTLLAKTISIYTAEKEHGHLYLVTSISKYIVSFSRAIVR